MSPVDAFLSYAADDEGLLEELEKHLALLERQGAIRPWHVGRIAGGDDRRSRRDEHLAAAQVVVLLVSASYLASDYLHAEEMMQALDRARAGKARVVPVLVRACDVKDAPFARYGVLPRNQVPVTLWPDRDAAWTDVVAGIRDAVEKLLETQARSPTSMEIDAGAGDGGEVQLTLRDGRGDRASPILLGPGLTRGRLAAFSEAIAAAAARGQPLDGTTLDEARALHAAVLQGPLALRPADGRVLHRLMIRDPFLHDLPWEALCEPGTDAGFWGTSAVAVLARGVSSKLPWEPREVRGAVRVLAVAPHGGEDRLRFALTEGIEDGSIEWLDPITGPQAGEHTLFESLRRSKVPHVLHFVGRGDADRAAPSLLLAGEGGRDASIEVKSLARELAVSFGGDLRLVVLEPGPGAGPGTFAGAPEILAGEGADAVIAHRLPMTPDAARDFSREVYRTLAGPGRALGDVGAAVRAGRMAVLLRSAEGFSPVLHLRGPGVVLFTFEGRMLHRPGPTAPARPLAPALLSLLERPAALILGDDGEDRAALRAELERALRARGDRSEPWMSLSALTQRYFLRFGRELLLKVFQDALVGKAATPSPQLVEALAHVVRPGVHVTLYWLPVLERALARQRPAQRILVFQPSLLDPEVPPQVFERPAGGTGWREVSEAPLTFDLRADLVVLRLHGGYYRDHAPEDQARFTTPVMTEDDQLYGLIRAEGFRPPEWADEIIAELRLRPGLFAGLSVFDWRHRLLLRWLYDQAPAPRGSLALLRPEADKVEPDVWNRGGGLPGPGKIASVREDPAVLADKLLALPAPGKTK